MHSLGPTSQEWTLVIALVSGMLLSVFAALPARTSTIVDGVSAAVAISMVHDHAVGEPPGSPAPRHCPLCTLLDAFTAAVLAPL